jgi:tetratricopeptide (TPR) repeat protein
VVLQMKFCAALLLALVLSSSAMAQHNDMEMKPAAEKPAAIVAGMGTHHHPVSTSKPEAQKFFDQGFAFVYAFNHDEAIRSFKRAAELDPELALAHWGIALALGPNINLDVDPDREKAAYEAVQKALALAAKAPENERAYIEALTKRYSIDPKADLKQLAVNYKNAMGEVVKRYPDDLDAATLYAEAAMDLRPWKFWTADGKPAEGTEEIVTMLESVLRRDPNHAGAIHYYIHAVEASPHPERALVYAPKLPALMPAAGHLVHMPAHIYERTGDYYAAALSNREAAKVDEAYIQAHGGQSIYPLMYYTHNLHFLAIASVTAGRFDDAMTAAKRLEVYVGPRVKEMPMLEGFMTVTPLALVQFSRWDDILSAPQPDAAPQRDRKLGGAAAAWQFARGMAFSAKGRSADANREYAALVESEKAIPADASFGLNSASQILKVSEHVLGARIAPMTKSDTKTSLELLRKAVELEDSLAYDEPPAWFIPTRQFLGGALLSSGDYAGAEQVFRADLERNRRSGRSLFGLMESLKAQKKNVAAAMVQREFESAWKDADTKLTIDDLWN